MTIVTTDKVSWSEDVLAFARGANVEQYLDPLLEATRELFPSAREIRVMVVRDPELADFDGIAWEVYIPEVTTDDYLRLTKEWGRAFLAICPMPLKTMYPFIKRLRTEKV